MIEGPIGTLYTLGFFVNREHPFFQYANSEGVADYNVTVGKVSGENITLCNSFSTKDPSLTLILSYSAYNISVRALNSVGSSPVSSIAIEQMDVLKGTLLSYATCKVFWVAVY